jgi:hypothetical protein
MEDYYTKSPMLGALTKQLFDFMQRIATKTTGNGLIKILEVGAKFEQLHELPKFSMKLANRSSTLLQVLCRRF